MVNAHVFCLAFRDNDAPRIAGICNEYLGVSDETDVSGTA